MHHTNLWSTKLFYLTEGLHCTCIFRTCVFHPYTDSYLRFPYMRFPSLRNALFRTCLFRTCVVQYLRFQRPLILYAYVLYVAYLELTIGLSINFNSGHHPPFFSFNFYCSLSFVLLPYSMVPCVLRYITLASVNFWAHVKLAYHIANFVQSI